MAKSAKGAPGLVERSRSILHEQWERVSLLAKQGKLADWVDGGLCEDIASLVNSGTKSYRYVLPTQLVAKLADPSLDCRCLQAIRGGEGAFDARTVAHNVIVPFDQTNHNVLGGSPEPYVNNPLRVPELSKHFRAAQKDKTGWDAICRVLGDVQHQGDTGSTERVFLQVLTAIYRRLADVHVVYPAPQRVSLDSALAVLSRFITPRSGGDRLLAGTSALFVVLGRAFHLYSEVHRAGTTAADAATGLLADLECVSEDGQIILVVEVKDRSLTITQFRSKMRDIRAKRVREVFFVAQKGIAKSDRKVVKGQVAREFVSGQNVYITDLTTLARTALSLLGEKGRRDFLREVGVQLDKYRSDIAHRKAWAKLLSSI